MNKAKNVDQLSCKVKLIDNDFSSVTTRICEFQFLSNHIYCMQYRKKRQNMSKNKMYAKDIFIHLDQNLRIVLGNDMFLFYFE